MAMVFKRLSNEEVGLQVSEHMRRLNITLQAIQKFHFDQILAKKLTKEEQLLG